MSTFIYADNAATTRLCDEAFHAMMPWLKDHFGNASTLYKLGREAKKALTSARQTIAQAIHAEPNEILFTSGGTESDNWAIKGTLHAQARKGKKHIITSSIEHHAVLNSVKTLQKDGFEATFLPVTPSGRVDPESLRAALRPDTALVSIMYANNETGVIQPIDKIGAICREAGIIFHTDAVQAVGTLPIDVKASKIDLLSISAHKFNGPKGIGALYCRRTAVPDTWFDGGDQERGHRAGTENIPAIVGMAEALSVSCQTLDAKAAQIRAIRDRVQASLLQIEGTTLNGDLENRLPGHLNISFDAIDGQSLLMELDLRQIAASIGSACDSGSMTPSHVLLQMGVPYTRAHGSLRLSFGRDNSLNEADDLIREITDAVATLRSNPPTMNG